MAPDRCSRDQTGCSFSLGALDCILYDTNIRLRQVSKLTTGQISRLTRARPAEARILMFLTTPQNGDDMPCHSSVLNPYCLHE